MNTFIFYRSFYDMICKMNDKERLEAYEAIARYGLDHTVPGKLPPSVEMLMDEVIQLLDRARANYMTSIAAARSELL